MAVARGWPAVRALVHIEWIGYGAQSSPAPLMTGAFVALAGTLALAGLVLDAGWERPVPPPLLLAALVCAMVPLRSVRGQDSDAALLRCGALLARQLHQGGEAVLPPGCARPLFRDRWLRPVPTRLLELDGATGPVRSPPVAAAPGTLVIARKGSLGWVTAVGLGADGPAMVRTSDAPWVAGFTGGGER